MAVDMREVLALPMVVEPNEERSSLMIEERKLKVQLTGRRRLRRPHSSPYLAAFAPAVPTVSRFAGMSDGERTKETHAWPRRIDESCDCAGPTYI